MKADVIDGRVEERRPGHPQEVWLSEYPDMAHHKKKRGPGPVPPGNQSRTGGPPGTPDQAEVDAPETARGIRQAAGQEQDPKRRLARYEGAGEHSLVQPGEDRGDRHVGD